MGRRLKRVLKRCVHAVFRLGQYLGWDILPRHFYSEIPDLRKLRRTQSWRQPYSLIGVAGAELDNQVKFLTGLVSSDVARHLQEHDLHQKAIALNGEPGFGPIEAECLFAFVARRRPQRIVQVGCGVSTAICLLAAEYAGYQPVVTCIEPFPNRFLQERSRAGVVRLIEQPVEDLAAEVPLEGFGAGDLFFVDSTHTLGPAGEVSRLILEWLPRLPTGSMAHFHDIYFPYDYSGDVLSGALVFPHESVLLHAFLAHNTRFQLRAALSLVHHRQPQILSDLFPRYQACGHDLGLIIRPGHFPSSAYLEAIA